MFYAIDHPTCTMRFQRVLIDYNVLEAKPFLTGVRLCSVLRLEVMYDGNIPVQWADHNKSVLSCAYSSLGQAEVN